MLFRSEKVDPQSSAWKALTRSGLAYTTQQHPDILQLLPPIRETVQAHWALLDMATDRLRALDDAICAAVITNRLTYLLDSLDPWGDFFSWDKPRKPHRGGDPGSISDLERGSREHEDVSYIRRNILPGFRANDPTTSSSDCQQLLAEAIIIRMFSGLSSLTFDPVPGRAPLRLSYRQFQRLGQTNEASLSFVLLLCFHADQLLFMWSAPWPTGPGRRDPPRGGSRAPAPPAGRSPRR